MSNRGTMLIFHPIAIATCAAMCGNPVGLMILIQAGVSVTCKRLLGTRHGFLTRRLGIFGEAEKLYFDMVEEVKHPKHWKY